MESEGELFSDLKTYLGQPLLTLKDDIFQYWNDITVRKVLKELAIKYLSVVGTSVPSERLFSKAGNIATESRNRLHGSRLSKLLFLNSLPVEDWHF